MRRFVALAAVGLLAACNSPEPEDEATQASEVMGTPALPGPADPLSADELALLEADDCRTVAEAYLDAIARRDFGFAEEFWDDPVIDAARLEALFAGYERPVVEIADVMADEDAEGVGYCAVTGALRDAANPEIPLRGGDLELRRAGVEPGIDTGQSRWRVVSSTFIEPLQRAARGGPS